MKNKYFRFNNLTKTAFQLAFLFCVHFSFGQEWTSYTTGKISKTLCSENVNSIVFDNEGSTWFGTMEGVSKFDGTNWGSYTTVDGLIDNWVTSIAIDNNNHLWFGTIGGVSKFDGTNWTSYTTLDGLINNWVTSIAIDNNNHLWCGTEGGVSKFDGTNWTSYTTLDGLINNWVTSIAIDNNNHLWCGTEEGVSKFDGTNWTSYTTTDGLISNSVFSIAVDKNNNVWFGTNGGVSKFDGANWVSYTTTDGLIANQVMSIAVDKNNNLWFGGTALFVGGVSKFDGTNWVSYSTTDGFISSWVTSIAIDKNDDLWFGSWDGVSKFDGTNWVSYIPKGLFTNNIASISVDKNNNVWFGTNGAASKFDGTNWASYTPTDGLIGKYVSSIAIDKNNKVWFGTNGGVSKFDGTNWSSYTTKDGLIYISVSSIAIDKNDNLWFGTFGGINKFDGTNWTTYTTKDGLIYNGVNSIAVDKNNNVWFGTWFGVSKFDGANWIAYTITDGLINNNVTSIAIDKNNNMWFGTNGGVSKFDGTNWTSYTTVDGLISNSVTTIAIDNNNNVWFGTKGGVSKFDGTNWIAYTTTDGLIDNNVTSIAIDQQGNKWIGTRGGDGDEKNIGGISKFSDGGAGPLDIFATYKSVVFNDENENGKKDENEKGISGQLVQIDSTFSFSQDNGFVYNELTDGAHTISFKAPENWKLTTESTFTINIPNDTDTLYFGIKAIENRPDLKVNVTSGPTRSNFSANYWVNYKNIGSVTESGTVEVILDSAIAFESSVPATSSIDGQKLRFDFTDLGVNESKQIRITAKMPNVEFLGDTLTTLVSISPIVLDVDSLNNRDTLRSVLTGSYDPNDKAVQQGVLDENYVLFGEKLNYTIRFQNTGTDTAFNVNISDTISSNMDVSSFELIGSSHPCQLEVKGTNTMVFHFYDILLPDSNVNEIGSHGYVQYSIKPKKGLAENTKVKNTGYIYFDYNPAIVTNTTLNTYVSQIPKAISTEGLSTISANNLFTLYPNPTESNFTVDLGKETRTVNVKITDIQGCLVKQESKENTRFVHLNLAENKGIFFVTVSTEKGEETLKVVSRH